MIIFALILLILIAFSTLYKLSQENTLDVGGVTLIVFFVLYLMGVGS
jgi:hypothetical protein